MRTQRKRFYFFGAHLGISSIVFLVFMYQIFFNWYPYNLFYTSGGWSGTKIVFVVDMILGPVLTLIITNPNKEKKELIRDLLLCAIIQIAALSYGIKLVAKGKPEFLSIHNGAVYVVMKDDIQHLPNKSFLSQYSQHPPLVYSEDSSRYDFTKTEQKEKARRILALSRKYGAPAYSIPESFDRIENRYSELNRITTRSLDSIKRDPAYSNEQYKQISDKNLFVLPIDGSFSNGYIALDKQGIIKGSICCH